MGHPGAREGLEFISGQKEGGSLGCRNMQWLPSTETQGGVILTQTPQHQPPESSLATHSWEERGYEIEGDCDLSTS